MNVLVVEDSREVVDAVSLCFELRWPGANVVSTSEGAQVLDLIQTEPPDVIILDLVLPGIDGFEVLRQIRRQSNVPVVILSVEGDEMDKVRGLELGADDYIVKPFAPAELLARLKRYYVVLICSSSIHRKSLLLAIISRSTSTHEKYSEVRR